MQTERENTAGWKKKKRNNKGLFSCSGFIRHRYSCSHAKNEFYLCHLELPWLHFGGSDTTSRSTLSCLALKYNSSAFKIPNSCLSEFDTGILRGLHENKYVMCISNLYAGRRKRLPRRIQKSPQSPVRR